MTVEPARDPVEAEYRWLAGLLHDRPVQDLVALAMRTQLLAARLPDPHRGEADTVTAAAARALDVLREVIARLRPPALDDGLVAALREHVAAVAPECELTAQDPPEPAGDVALAVFRAVQCLLPAAEIRLTPHEGGLLTRVRGGDPAGAGLAAARVAAVDGWCRDGVTVDFWVPTPG
ncbi:histidine kinase [Amycolatopsis suaedae]|uniref:histidine kinase n=1 Tax=Amycolatopsis suaedae TaxID=2510978 RepID=A0A4Q7J330_9PSEU|nr:histidine kinase [Amycolatopsis suaedae]RZQ61359.1 hypothetical protein EWH70_23470 [Amycolatopsis suaedae]